MNNTLTGLGLALVLALLAALIGPWFVNWTAYRDDFAAQASALVGAPVTVSGAVDARLLPTPYVRFRALSSGAGATRLSVDEVEIELAIAPLLRGEVKAERIRLVRPRLGVEIAADGAVRTAFSSGKGGAPARVSFDRAEIVDGALSLATPQGTFGLDRIAGVAEAGSLSGPYKFEGVGGPDGGRLNLRASTSRAEAGAMRVKVAAARTDGTLAFEADGAIAMADKPAFEGRVALSGPADRRRETATAEPWRTAAAAKVGAGRLKFDDLDLAYGPDERGVRLAGTAEATFGADPQFDLRLETRQIDFDRLLGEGRPKTPAGVLSEIASRLPAGVRPPANASLTLDARGVVLGGDVLQDLRLELAAARGDWRLRRASAVFPGDARVSASGAVAFSNGEPGFVGPVSFDARDLASFRRWLGGGSDQSATPVRRVSLKGELSARPGAVSIDDATIETDGARSTGRVSWAKGGEGKRSRMEAALDSDRLDLDALGLDRLMSQALSAQETDALVALDAESLVLSGVAMSGVSVDVSLDARGLDLKRLEVRDAGGAKVSGAGRFAMGTAGPEGAMGFKVAAAKLGSLVALARAAGAPVELVEALERRSAALAPADVSIDVDVGPDGHWFSVSGAAAGGRIDAEVSTPSLSLDADAEAKLRIASPDGRKLAALAGVGLSPLVDAQGGEISLRLSGAPAKGMTGEGRFASLGLDLTGRGAVGTSPSGALSVQADVSAKAEDLVAVAAVLGRASPVSGPRLPATFAAKLALDDAGARLDDLKGDVAGRRIVGQATLPSDPSRPIEGRFALDDLPLAALIALAVSPDAAAGQGQEGAWQTTPFGPSPVRGIAGRFEVSAARMPLGAGQVATDAAFTLALKRDAIAVEGFSAALDGGRLSGTAAIARADEQATTTFNLALENAAAEQLMGIDRAASPVLGGVGLKIEGQASGRSIAGLVGSLTGAGSVSVTDMVARRLDPTAVDRIEPQVEAGLALDAGRVAAALNKELAAADFHLPQALAGFTISGGVLRTGALEAQSDGVRLGGGASVDLRRRTLDADLTLQPARPGAPQIGVALDGPISSPSRRIDATAFTGWLSVRAVERETARIEAMEADARERARVARERQEEERKRAEAEKARLEAERRKVEAERRKREAEAGAALEVAPRTGSPGSPWDPDLSTPSGPTQTPPPSPPAGVFSPQGQTFRPADRSGRPNPGRQPEGPALPAPTSILPPAATAPR